MNEKKESVAKDESVKTESVVNEWKEKIVKGENG